MRRQPSESTAIDPFHSASNQRALDESFEQLNHGDIVTKTLDDLERMVDCLIGYTAEPQAEGLQSISPAQRAGNGNI